MIPAPIYEILPYVYITIGFLSSLNVSPVFGRISGILLLATGIIIYRMRREYRKGR